MDKKVLLIDDLRDFRDNRECVIARTSLEALNILSAGELFDEIWLDHDLGEIDGINDSTMVIVDFLSKEAFYGNPYPVKLIIVHTSNPVGKKQILASLERYGYETINVNATEYFIV